MEYVKKSFAFLGKNILICIPLYVAITVPLFFMGNLMNAFIGQITQFGQSMMSGGGQIDPQVIIQQLLPLLQNMAGASSMGGLVGLVLTFIAVPGVLGLIKKGMAGEEVSLEQFMTALRENFIQYLLCFLGMIIVGIIAGIGFSIIIVILTIIAVAAGVPGAIIAVILLLAIVILSIYFSFRIFALWLPSMILDKTGMFEGLKKGFNASKGSFWLFFLVLVVVLIGTGIVQAILGFLNNIVIIGPLVMGAISTIASFFLSIFTMMLYQGKTKAAAAPASTETT